MILVVGGPGTAILATRRLLPARARSVVLGVALAFGLSLLCAAYAIGSISGCHINPAVTVGLVGDRQDEGGRRSVLHRRPGRRRRRRRGDHLRDRATATRASARRRAASRRTVTARTRRAGSSSPAVILTEVVFTALFVFVIASTSRKSMAPGFTGITVGLMLTVIHLITIPVDNTSVNPARSLATAVFQHGWALEPALGVHRVPDRRRAGSAASSGRRSSRPKTPERGRARLEPIPPTRGRGRARAADLRAAASRPCGTSRCAAT